MQVILNKYLKKKANLKITKNDLVLKAGRFPEDSATHEIVVILEDSFSSDFYEKILEEETKITYSKKYTSGDWVYYFLPSQGAWFRLSKDDVKKVKKLTNKDYFVGGCTALYDALGNTINSMKQKDTDKVLFIIITDGYENSSKEYKQLSFLRNLVSNY